MSWWRLSVATALRRMAYIRFDAARFMQRGTARDKGLRRADEVAGEMVAKVASFWHRCSIVRPPPWVRPEFGRGCSSGVEHDLAKVGVEGSNPFARSRILPILPRNFRCVRRCVSRSG